MAHDVFISHSSKDKAVADAVCATLEQHHIRCWIAPRDIGPGQEWGESIVTAIHSSRVMVLIFSASANESPQIRREVERAVHKSVVIVPMRIEDVLPQKSLEYFIGAVHWLDAFSKPLENYLENLAGVVTGILGSPVSSRPVAAGGVTQAKGMPRVWLYAAGGIGILLIGVVFAFQTLRHSGSGPETLPSGAANPPTMANRTATASPATVNSETIVPSATPSPTPEVRKNTAARTGATAAIHLRSEQQTVTGDEAKVIVVTHSYFHAAWNTGGKGLAHQYETKALQNTLVVTDHATGLMWQRGGSGDIVQGGKKGAEDYIQKLNEKKVGGFSDWRLPTLEEAMSLMTAPEKGQPEDVEEGEQTLKKVIHLDPAFETAGAYFLWTSDLRSPTSGWVVYFLDGTCNVENLNMNAYVRAVRSLA